LVTLQQNNQNKMSPIIFFVEGNIGSGKSTFLKNLSESTASYSFLQKSQFVQEPVNIWKNTKDSDGRNILDHFYYDMNRFCYAFQSFAFISRIKQLDEIDMNTDCIFIERSVYCDRNVFASACHESGMMTDIEWEIYRSWFKWMEDKYRHIFQSARYIYLQCSPATALQRIGHRGRAEETGISYQYLETLHNKHNDWLCNSKTSATHQHKSSTIVIDADKNLLDKENMSAAIKQIEQSIQPIEPEQQNTPRYYKHKDWQTLANAMSRAAKPINYPIDQKKLI